MKMSFEYIAGFFDGEGSISTPMGKNHHQARLALPQSGDEGKQVLDEICEFLSERGITYNRSKPRMTSPIGKRIMHQLEVGANQSAILLLRGILPYLRVKKVKAQDTLRFLQLFPSTRGIRQREHHAKRRAQGIPYHLARRAA